MRIVLRSRVDSLVVIYYASNVFVSLGLTGGTTSLLATGVTGVVFMVSTVPAMVSGLYITQYCGCH
jgi:hypothetical protein